jgi:ubiquitin C-terminal hydrolase
MNSTLQCLLHVNELVNYFLYEYKNDKTTLKKKNKNAITLGEISDVFYNLVIGVYQDNNDESISEIKISSILNPKTSINKSQINNKYQFKTEKDSFSPYQFKRTLGFHNPQFKDFKANDSKDLLLYLLQTMHEELNYFGDNPPIRLSQPNQSSRESTFMYFMNFYNSQNFSIISKIFYGTYETITKCKECKTIIYNFQKFEFISFGMFKYHKKTFDIMDGFKDNEEEQILKGNNKFYCNNCKMLVEAILTCKIIQPPNKLIINIDYGKNKKYHPSNIKFGDTIDITKFVNFNFGTRIRYEITGICTHFGSSGEYGHYITFCKHKKQGKWYSFNDSSCKEIENKKDIYKGSPYILLYEKLD